MRVTILSGFLGSGKTTLLRALLRHPASPKVAVIVNDMSALEVDGDLVREGHHVSEAGGNLRSLYAGSIGSDKRSAFSQVLVEWQGRTDVEHLVVETSGSTHPWPLVEEVLSHPAYQLDTFATLVDARAFIEDYGAGKVLFERLVANEDTGRRGPENLLAEQIQFASLVILTKTDRVNTEDLPFVIRCLEILNPHARILPVTRGAISPTALLGAGGFSADKARLLARAWRQGQEGTPALEDHGIGSTVICDPRPLHPQRLWNLFRHQLGHGIYRSKGFIWMPSRDDQVLLWNQAAGSVELELLAYWRAALVRNPHGILLPEEITALKERLKDAHPQFGDRLNELTVIGTTRDREAFVPGLEACFCTPAEIARWQAGGTFEDPWPKQLKKAT